MLKQFLITFCLFWLFQAWFILPMNNMWWEQKIAVYYQDFKKEKSKNKWTNRWKERHGYNYSVPKDLAPFLSEEKDTLLLPPKKYFTKIEPQLDPYLQWLDHRWFYYMADKKIRLATIDSESLNNATHTILFDNKSGFFLQPLKEKTLKDSLITLFKEVK